MNIPVNSPSRDAATVAVMRELEKLRPGGFRVIGCEQIEKRPDDAVAIVITRPSGPRRTWMVEAIRTTE